MKKIHFSKLWSFGIVLQLLLLGNLTASSHREAPLISNDPLADNVDLYAFKSPDNPNTITIIATYVPLQLPHGGPNYYNFGENVRYEIHVDNDASMHGDEITYRFTFNIENEDPTTFFNIRLSKQNQKATYKLERSIDGGKSFQTIVERGGVPPNNIGPRSIESGVGLNTDYATLFKNAITQASTGEMVFAGPTDDPFFVDLGGIFDLGDAPRQSGKAVDGLACYNVHSIAIQIPISTLLKSGAAAQPQNILDSDYVIGVWASASRPAIRTLSKSADPIYSGDWVQVSRLGMPLTNEAVIPIGDKDYWNSITPYDEIAETTMDQYFFNPELALYMDDDLFGGAVPAFAPLRIQKSSLGAFDFTNGADGLFGLKGNPALAGTALDDAVFGTLLLPGPGMPRSVDLWPAFHTGVPNVIPYQLATGKNGNPLAVGKPFVNNFLPNGGDMLRLNMAVPLTPRDDANFSSLGLIQAAAIGLTVAPFNTNADLEFLPNMDGFPNGRRLEDDVTRIELQAVSGVVLAAVGLWYDDFIPQTSASPVTQHLLNVLSYSTGVEKNDKEFTTTFPYLAMPHGGTGSCSGELIENNAEQGETVAQMFVSSNLQTKVGVYNIDADNDISMSSFDIFDRDADGIVYDETNDVLYQLSRSANVINAYSGVNASLKNGSIPSLTATSSADFTNGREIAMSNGKLVVTQDASESNGNQNKLFVYDASPTNIILEKSHNVDINLWGVHLTGSTLYAVVDNSNRIAIYNDFFDRTTGAIAPDKTVSIEALVRTHGLFYDADADIMFLTDVGDAASATDGAVVIVKSFLSVIQDDMVDLSEQVRISGPNSSLGNPVDIGFDQDRNMLYVAERASKGGQVLGFSASLGNGDATPSYISAFAGASAIFVSGNQDKEKICTVAGGNLTTISGGTFVSICAGDGISDAFNLNLMNNLGDKRAWIITDANDNILGLPASGPFDLEGAGNGNYKIYNISYRSDAFLPSIGGRLSDITGCFDLSNPIIVERLIGAECLDACDADGGSIILASGGATISQCVGEVLFSVRHISSSSLVYYYIIIDDSGLIVQVFKAQDGNTLLIPNLASGQYTLYGWSADSQSAPVVGALFTALTSDTCGELSSSNVAITILTTLECSETCHAPRNVRVRSTGEFSNLSWEKVEGATSYQIVVTSAENGKTFTVPVRSRSVRINSRKALFVKVRAVCEGGSLSEFSQEISVGNVSNVGLFASSRSADVQVIEDEIETTFMTVYPNPVSSVLNVSISRLSTNAQLSVYDMLGALRLRQNVASGQEYLQLNIDNLANGIYHLQLSSSAEMLDQKKVIKTQ